LQTPGHFCKRRVGFFFDELTNHRLIRIVVDALIILAGAAHWLKRIGFALALRQPAHP
jgi:hypothetical protein